MNELREVVEEVVDAGADHDFGLEVGKSGAICRAGAPRYAECLLICNGYKDADFIRTALTGRDWVSRWFGDRETR